MTPAEYRAALEALGLSQLAAAEAFLMRAEPEPNSGCWLWSGNLTESGYGRVTIGRKDYRAHRVSWALANGRGIPDGAFICHRCDTPSCINPAHLFPGSNRDNVRDMIEKGRKASTAGDRHGKRKLTADIVRAIRQSSESHAAIARSYGLSPQAVCNARSGKTWRAA